MKRGSRKKSVGEDKGQRTLTTMGVTKKRAREDEDEEEDPKKDTTEKEDTSKEGADKEEGVSKEKEEGGGETSTSDEATTTQVAKKAKTGPDFIKEEGWRSLLRAEMSKPYFDGIFKFLANEEKNKQIIYPPRAEVFSAFESCPLEKTRVVIIGQDPYHGAGQAHGLCFSVKKGVEIPASLRNIYKEAKNDVGIAMPTHGCLQSWSEQGVLLLNTVLTVRKAEPNSHKGQGWETFTDTVIRLLTSKKENLVFLLWGKPAQAKAKLISNPKSHCIINSSHPSPLGANSSKEPFIGSKCFSRANEYLIKHGLEPIDWNVV